jgi:hypothetical protein
LARARASFCSTRFAGDLGSWRSARRADRWRQDRHGSDRRAARSRLVTGAPSGRRPVDAGAARAAARDIFAYIRTLPAA